MNEQTLKNIPPFLKELEKMATCIYIAADAEAAADVNLKTRKVVKLVNDLLEERQMVLAKIGELQLKLESTILDTNS